MRFALNFFRSIAWAGFLPYLSRSRVEACPALITAISIPTCTVQDITLVDASHAQLGSLDLNAAPFRLSEAPSSAARQSTAENTEMTKAIDSRQVAERMLSWVDLELVSCTELQALWAGYGHVCAIEARGKSAETTERWCKELGDDVYCADRDTFRLILKFVSPPPAVDSQDEGHLRKIMSYQVEQAFYEEVAGGLDESTVVPVCLVSTRSSPALEGVAELRHVTATLLTDLRPKFPIAGEKRAALNERQVSAALNWLARFHGNYWKGPVSHFDRLVLPPLEEYRRRNPGGNREHGWVGDALWLNGGYTYLATRRTEYSYLAEDESSEWSTAFCDPVAEGQAASTAETVAEFLTPKGRPFETYIHGDVKSENLFSTEDGQQVAFYDFQYVGMGLGVCDLAKLFTCSVPLSMLVDSAVTEHSLPMGKGEKQLLEQYRETLLENRHARGNFQYDWDVFVRHWECALVDWCRFQASWGFWGNTAWLEARTRSILADEGWRQWLLQNTE
ncbi:uncharacterized protein E0L32_002441 [Thyridium curvatum]|uniref:Aminoglycoside phosphotransferase domain-containing protein n=1 Tax=Thyridium curvatum TaxID=1093900 RepID=A0A507BIJ3_9PEZI|nr:uncharacterized protein E0L32_002441 [Thyridium curvatum]TPX18584.1 hypothetical protein E0L32_002441 [Thyridium curvatum]